MKGGLIISCCLFILLGCKNNNRIPHDIIPQKDMQAVLWDIMRADQFLVDFVIKKDSSLDKKTESSKLYQQIFDLHHITKDQFRESFSFYQKHQDLFKIIMDSLSMPLNEAPTIMIKQPIIIDSNQTTSGTDSLHPLRKKKLILTN
jgi:hypothetical protein